jgi:hypothetical protein
MGYLIGITGSFILAAIFATLYTLKEFKNK